MVTYAYLVWWPKIKQLQAKNLFKKVQRLASICITGAMSTCPTTAMEAILELTS